MKDILRVKTNEYKAAIENGEVSAFRSKDLVKTGVRIFKDGKIASASYVGEISEDELFKMAEQNAVVAMPSDVEIKSAAKLKKDIMGQCQVTRENLASEAERQSRKLREALPQFIFNGHFIRRQMNRAYTNSLGAQLEKDYAELETVLAVRRQGSPNIIDDFAGCGDFMSLEQNDYMKLLVEQLSEFDNVVPVPAGRHKVMFEVEHRGHLRKLSESLQVDKYCEGTAIYSGKNGEKILSDKVTFIDTYLQPEKGVLSPFDDEGTVASSDSLILIENGVLKNQICDLRYGKKYGRESTGNGFRSFNGSTRLGFAGLQMLGGQRNYREILADAGDVIMIKLAAGGDFTDKGDYSSPIQLAYLMKDGKVAGRLPPIAMSSSIEKMFGTDLLEVAANGSSRSSLNPFVLVEADIQTY